MSIDFYGGFIGGVLVGFFSLFAIVYLLDRIQKEFDRKK